MFNLPLSFDKSIYIFCNTLEVKEKTVPRENSTSDSEENSGVKDSDQQSVGDTDNQVSESCTLFSFAVFYYLC